MLFIAQNVKKFLTMQSIILSAQVALTVTLSLCNVFGFHNRRRYRMKTLKSAVFMLLLLAMMFVMQEQQKMIIPIIIQNHNATLAKLQMLGVNSKEIAHSIDLASQQSGISQNFLIALMYTESTGNPKAVSNLNYKGLMQIPWPVYYTDANMIIGAHIFNEKMRITNRNVEKALCLYKGYPLNSEKGLQQARKVLKLYDKLSEVSV